MHEFRWPVLGMVDGRFFSKLTDVFFFNTSPLSLSLPFLIDDTGWEWGLGQKDINSYTLLGP